MRLGVGGIVVPFPVHVMNRVQQLLTWGCGRYCTGGVAISQRKCKTVSFWIKNFTMTKPIGQRHALHFQKVHDNIMIIILCIGIRNICRF